MAKIQRYNGNLKAFGADAVGTERSLFGDGAGTQSDDLTDNINAALLRGWGSLALGEKPPREWFNSAHWVATQLSAYLHQMGVAEWNAAQEYYVNAVTNHNGVLWRLRAASAVGSEPGVSSDWTPENLGAYNGLASLATAPALEGAVVITGSFYENNQGGGGVWTYQPSADKADHDGVTIVDPARVAAWDGTAADLATLFTAGTGSGCWVRNFSGVLPVEAAGLVADWNGSTGTNNATAFDQLLSVQSITEIEGSGGDYYFGTVANNTVQHTVDRDLIIDWRGSSIIVNSVSGAAGVGTTFIAFVDCKARMHNYTFDDLDFDFLSSSRGVVPVLIRSATQSVSGHRIGPCHVERGQSILTCTSDDPNTHWASDVKLVGPCSGGNVYYGVNLAANGDNFVGELNLVETLRIMFVYGVKNFYLKATCETSRASSGFVNVSNDPRWRSTDNIKADITVEELAGPLLIATVSDTPANDGIGEITGVEVSLRFNTLGGSLTTTSNLIQFRSYDSTSATMTTGTAEIDRVAVDLSTPLELVNPIGVLTSSPNYGGLSLKGAPVNYSNVSDFHIIKEDYVVRTVFGDTTVLPVDTELGYLLAPSNGPAILRLKVDVTAQEDAAFFGQNSTIASFNVIGFVTGGALNLLSVDPQGQTDVGTATPVISITADGANMRTTVSGFASEPNGQITVTSRALQ